MFIQHVYYVVYTCCGAIFKTNVLYNVQAALIAQCSPFVLTTLGLNL